MNAGVWQSSAEGGVEGITLPQDSFKNIQLILQKAAPHLTSDGAGNRSTVTNRVTNRVTELIAVLLC